jgi:biofilm protein TabA
MIVDTLNEARSYFDMHPGMEAAFTFLRDAVRTDPEPGEYEIDGRDVYAIVQDCVAKEPEDVRLEAHKKYIDIQLSLHGEDRIGWSPLNECTNVDHVYDPANDVELYTDTPQDWFMLKAEVFCILLPQDAHAPLAGTGPSKKVVVKVAVPNSKLNGNS